MSVAALGIALAGAGSAIRALDQGPVAYWSADDLKQPPGVEFHEGKAGDVINMPPSTPHQSLPDPGGFTYMLVKVNVGTYPWSLVEQ